MLYLSVNELTKQFSKIRVCNVDVQYQIKQTDELFMCSKDLTVALKKLIKNKKRYGNGIYKK